MNHMKSVIVALCLILALPGCDNTKGQRGGVGNVPRLRDILAYNVNDPDNPTASFSFNTGDNISFSILVEDVDLDVETLWWTKYGESLDTPLDGPDSVSLPTQKSDLMAYSKVLSMTIADTPGTYLIIFQVEDENGNKSKEYPFSYTVK